MANTAFSKKPSNFQAYMDRLDELTRKNRGGSFKTGYDVNPNTQLLPGRVVDPTGLGDRRVADSVQFDSYSPDSIKFSAPNIGSSAGAPPTPQPQVQGASTTSGLSAQDFFNQIAESIYAPQTQQSPDGMNYTPTTPYTPNVEQGAYEVATMNDGNVLWSDGWVRPPLPEYLSEGATGLSKGLFGRSQTITQPYGNYNPIEPTPGNINLGTDFRTKDLENREIKNFFAEPLEVVEIYNQARPGTGRVGNMENRGYGNSILLRRTDGSMIRVSHFDQLGQFQPGQMINPGETIGVPGSTGNVTGEHADVETYSADGQIVSPDQFMAKVREESSTKQNLYRPEDQQRIQPEAPQAQQPQQPAQSGLKLAMDDARSYAQKFKSNAGQAIEQAKPTGNFDLGITETLQNKPEEARQAQASTIENIGTKLGAPELQTGELSAQQKTNPFRQLAGNLVDVATTPLKKIGLPDTGFSEYIAGGKTVNTDARLAPQAGASEGQNFSKAPTPEDYAGVLGQNVRDVGQTIQQPVQKAIELGQNLGQGLVSKAKDFMGKLTAPGVQEVPSPMQQSPDSIQVGQVSGDQQISAQTPARSGDTRDPFFKYGGNTQFKDFLKPNAEQLEGGALSTNLFNNDFYKNPEAVGAVFGKTSQAGDATNLYKDYLKSNVKEGYDQPYNESIVEENGITYKVLTPVKEYFENKFWNDKLSSTPERLTSDFSYGDSEVPDVKEQQFKGEQQVIPTDNPFFKSGAANLFKTAGDRTAQFAKGIGNKVSDIYKASPFSKTVSLPEKLKQSVSAPQQAPKISMPQQSRQVISVNGSNDRGGDNGGSQPQQGSAPNGSVTPQQRQQYSTNKTANYATGNIAKQLRQPVQSPPQPKPIYQPFAKLQQWMRGF